MGNEEGLLHFRRIYITVYVNPAWSGQRHVGDFADVDGLRELQTTDVLNVRRRIAKRSRARGTHLWVIRIPDMPLPDQEKRANNIKGTKQIKATFLSDAGFSIFVLLPRVPSKL
jgi:hypothetical protein